MSSYIPVNCPECDKEVVFNCSNDTSREDMLKLLDTDGRACRFCGARMIPVGVLPRIRGKLNNEIKVALIMKESWPDNTFFIGRLDGLLWARDHLLYNMKEID